ncbi:hypothetical protein N7451_007322 [Penicillium sp. IBT 35674x]|nr:hypothetical protein N7451_007322 [Penicillium sp. IBT 35674x]
MWIPKVYPDHRRNRRRPEVDSHYSPGGGDWNVLREDGIGHLFAKYTIKSSDGVPISVTNEGWIRKFRRDAGSEKVAEDQWYAKTNPRFEVQGGPHDWLNRTVFVGELRKPSIPNHVDIDVYSVE